MAQHRAVQGRLGGLGLYSLKEREDYRWRVAEIGFVLAKKRTIKIFPYGFNFFDALRRLVSA